jgi:hypothetical protein
MIKTGGRRLVAGRTVKEAKEAAPPAPPRTSPRPGDARICLGEIVSWDEQGPIVDFAGNPGAPLRARLTAAANALRLAPPPAAALGQWEVVLLIDARPERAPVVLGLLAPLAPEPNAVEVEARVDGRRVELAARDASVLRCGDASITLRRNGRIAIRGVDVETRAAGLNRIKGGRVNIN